MRTDLSFQQATEKLQAFLQTEKRPHVVRWVFREDLIFYKRNILLRWPLPAQNEQLAQELYNQGQAKGLGFALEICGFDQANAYGYVLVPADSADAEALMMTPLKLSYVTDQRKVIKIRSKLVWQIIQKILSNRTDITWLDFVPLRNPT